MDVVSLVGTATAGAGWGVNRLSGTPAFQSAGVEAVAYRVADPGAAHAGLYLIPESEVERLLLAERIVAEALPDP